MNDKLHKFILDNREAFDTDRPGPGVWNGLQHKIKVPGTVRRRHHPALLWAASFAGLVILSVIALGIFQKRDSSVEPAKSAGQNTEMVNLLGPIQARQLTRFHEVIELKQNELKAFEKVEPQLYRQFVSDIYALDSTYSALKAQLPNNPNKELLLEAMIANLQLQSELLSRYLGIIKEIKQKSINNEKQIS